MSLVLNRKKKNVFNFNQLILTFILKLNIFQRKMRIKTTTTTGDVNVVKNYFCSE